MAPRKTNPVADVTKTVEQARTYRGTDEGYAYLADAIDKLAAVVKAKLDPEPAKGEAK